MSAMSGVVGFGGGGREKTYFELQREALIGEIAMVRSRPPISLAQLHDTRAHMGTRCAALERKSVG